MFTHDDYKFDGSAFKPVHGEGDGEEGPEIEDFAKIGVKRFALLV